jgi:hypothetical protein
MTLCGARICSDPDCLGRIHSIELLILEDRVLAAKDIGLVNGWLVENR